MDITQLKKLGLSDESRDEIENNHKMGLITTELEPIKCPKCGSVNYVDITTDRIDLLITEYDRKCADCNHLWGCWSYGHWMP